MSNDVNFTIPQCARMLGKDKRTIKSRIEKANLKPVGKCKGFDAYFLGDVARVVYEKETTPSKSYQLESLSPKERKDHFDAAKKEIELKLMQGEVVYYHEAAKAYSELGKMFSNFFPTTIDDLEQTNEFTPKQLAELQDKFDEARQRFLEEEFSVR